MLSVKETNDYVHLSEQQKRLMYTPGCTLYAVNQ